MNGDPPPKPKSARRVAFAKWAFVGAIAGAALISACSQPSDSQQTAQQQASDEQARKEADEKAWADAEKAGTAAAYTAYLQNFGSGAHVSEASQRIVALNETARKAADEKAWADAEKAGTAAAYTAYIQNFGGGAHVAEARQRVAELSRKEADDKAWADAKLGQLDSQIRTSTPSRSLQASFSSSVGGTSMPSALAVCRLMMNSNLLACMSTPYGLPPGHPRLELLPPHFLSGIRGGNGGGDYATDFDGGCVVLHDADCCQCIRTVKPCSEPDSIGCVTQ